MRTLLAIILLAPSLHVTAQQSRTSGGGGGGSATNLTPWTSDIDGAGHSLSSVANIAFSGKINGNGVALTNVSLGGRTFTVGSNANFATLSNAVSAALAGDTLLIVGSQNISTSNFLHDATINGGTVYSSTDSPNLLVASNVLINGVTFSNTVSTLSLGGSILRGPTNGVGFVVADNCRFYGKAFGFANVAADLFYGIVCKFNNCLFSGNIGADIWRSTSWFQGCTFAANTSAANMTQGITCNDYSVNNFNGCTFLGGTNTKANVGATIYLGSTNVFNNCDFRMTNSSGAVGFNYQSTTGEAAVINPEPTTWTKFNNCFFQLSPQDERPVMLLYVDSANDYDDGFIELNNCFYTPVTNGVVVVNDEDAGAVIVRGGNLVPSNFSHPENVLWGVSPGPSLGAMTAIAGPFITTNAGVAVKSYNAGSLSNLQVNAFAGNAVFYTGLTNIGATATTLVISIGHTLANTNYTPSVSVLGAALGLGVSPTPTFTALTTTTFTMNLPTGGIGAADILRWSVIASP